MRIIHQITEEISLTIQLIKKHKLKKYFRYTFYQHKTYGVRSLDIWKKKMKKVLRKRGRI